MVSEAGEIPTCEEDADPELPLVPEPPGTTDCERPPSRARRIVRTVIPVLIAVGLVSFVVSSVGPVRDAATSLGRVRPRWIFAAVGAEATCYVLLSLHLRVLAGPRDNAKKLAPLRTALVEFGLGSVLPAAPAEGLVMAGNALRQRGVARRRTLIVLGVSQWFGTGALYALGGLAALAVAAAAGLEDTHRLLLAGAGVTVLAGLGLSAWTLSRPGFAEWAAVAGGKIRHFRKHNRPPTAELRERGRAWHEATFHVVAGPRAWLLLLATSTGAWAFDALCLYWALRASGGHVAVPVLILACTAGAAASMIPLLPAGLGVVDTITPAILALAGVPVSVAIAAIIIYRLIGTLLPAACGAVALLSLHVEKPDEEPGAGGPSGLAPAA